MPRLKIRTLRKEPPKSFNILKDAAPYIEEWAVMNLDATTEDIYKEFQPKIKMKYKKSSFAVLLSKYGVTESIRAARSGYKKGLKEAIAKIKKDEAKKTAGDIAMDQAVREKMLEKVARDRTKRALKHMEFVNGELNRAKDAIKRKDVNPLTVESHLDILDKHDKIARRTYGVDELSEAGKPDPAKMQLAVIIGFQPQEKKVNLQHGNHQVLEAQLTDSSDDL